jgi:hypothetical protein
MVAPVVPSQFEVGKNKIVHKPTKAAFSFDTGHTTFKSVNWGRAGEPLSNGQNYRKDDVMRVAQQLLAAGGDRRIRAWSTALAVILWLIWFFGITTHA